VAYIPPGTEWFLAELVEEIRVSGEDGQEIHAILVLIQASEPETAYSKALDWGRAHELDFTNTEGRPVTIRYLGISSLNVVYEPLVDGAELIDSIYGEATPELLGRLLVQKCQLNVFRPITPLF
jgi:hypothetical protein